MQHLIKAGSGTSARCLRTIRTFIWTVYFMASNQEFDTRLAINMSPCKMEALIFLHGPFWTNNNSFKKKKHFLNFSHHTLSWINSPLRNKESKWSCKYIVQGDVCFLSARQNMDAEAFGYSLAFNRTCSSRSRVFSVPWEEQWYTAAWGVAGMSVATGECLSVCLSPPSRPHHSFPLQKLSFHFDVGTFSGPKHWTVHKAGWMSLLCQSVADTKLALVQLY